MPLADDSVSFPPEACAGGSVAKCPSAGLPVSLVRVVEVGAVVAVTSEDEG